MDQARPAAHDSLVEPRRRSAELTCTAIPATTRVLINDISEAPVFSRLAERGFVMDTIYHVDVVAFHGVFDDHLPIGRAGLLERQQMFPIAREPTLDALKRIAEMLPKARACLGQTHKDQIADELGAARSQAEHPML